jgi:hypothetical protein
MGDALTQYMSNEQSIRVDLPGDGQSPSIASPMHTRHFHGVARSLSRNQRHLPMEILFRGPLFCGKSKLGAAVGGSSHMHRVIHSRGVGAVPD